MTISTGLIRMYNARNLVRGVFFPPLFDRSAFDTVRSVEQLMDYTKIDDAWWDTLQPEIQPLVPRNLKHWRAAAGYSSSGMAKAMHISKDAYRSYENSRRRIPFGRLDTVSYVLGVSVTRLVSRPEDDV